jgi:hypothetical protein
MIRAVLSLVIGLTLLGFGIYEVNAWHDLPANRVPLAYLAVMMGLVISLLASLSLAYPRRRRIGTVGDTTGAGTWVFSAGSSDHGGHGHGGDCGHSGDGSGCGGDGADGH